MEGVALEARRFLKKRDGAEPPQASRAQAACSYVDDVCCPGTINTDAGVDGSRVSDPDAGT